MRSLCEDEEHLLTFYAFPPVMHRYIRSTNAIESLFSNVRQRTDQIDALYFGDLVSGHRLGRHARYSLAKDPSRVTVEAGWVWANKQPAKLLVWEEVFFCCSACAISRVPGSLFY